MLVSDPVLFAFALLDTAGILFLLIYFVITLSDLECDYLNAQQCCSKLNFWVLPKFGAQAFINIMLLLHEHWILMLVNLPMTMWYAFELYAVPKGNTGVYDPTEIHNRGQLKKHMRDCMIYLGFFLVLFFIYLYCLIIALLKGDPISRSDEIVTEF
ncbi:hypothetical protein B566_EDAN002928 [Ephemera danica]|nr:hypothetical protein B566_EDAN002928 [Ephemera danica]